MVEPPVDAGRRPGLPLNEPAAPPSRRARTPPGRRGAACLQGRRARRGRKPGVGAVGPHRAQAPKYLRCRDRAMGTLCAVSA